MRQRRHEYLVRFYDDNDVHATHILRATSVDQVKLQMECYSPNCRINAIFELKQVWGEG